MNKTDLSKEIDHAAIQCGFDDCGIISIDALAGFEELYQKRMDDVPQSQFFYNKVGDLQGTKKRFPWAKSIVILVFNYGKYRYPKELQGKYAKAFFLQPDKNSDYGLGLQRFEHWLAKRGIHAEGGTQFGNLSIGPLRYMAAKAGLGIIRKNNFFYTQNGSYNNLVGYVIDEKCEWIHTIDLTPCGEKCHLCQSACKTKALQAPYTLDPFKCVSYLTTFGNSDIPAGSSFEKLEEWVCGCDNCQDACPHNRKHDWNTGDRFANLEEIASLISPSNYRHLSDSFLIEQVIPKTAEHLQPSDVNALRENAERAFKYQQTISKDK